MGRKRNAMPGPPPATGGYEFEIMELGPPVYHTPAPPAKYRGPLVPAGDGGELPPRPAPPAQAQGRKNTPLVPKSDEVRTLPRFARVAFAARCARRTLPLARELWKTEYGHDAARLRRALDLAERIAAEANTATDEALTARDEIGTLTANLETVSAAVGQVVAAACAAVVTSAKGASSAADFAALVLFETAMIDTPLTAQLRCIRRDFVRLKKLARKQKWTDDTPVPPEVFGPMWPEGVAPYWAVEPPADPPPAVAPPAGA